MTKRHQERAAEALRRFHETHVLKGHVTPGRTSVVTGKARASASDPVSLGTDDPVHEATPGRRSEARQPMRPVELPADLRAYELLSRERLIMRWSCGSDSTFHRAERDGLLLPRRDGSRTGYTWSDVFAFEGGQPPEGLDDDYRKDLLTETKVAALSTYTADTIIQKAKRGEIRHRRIGRFYRFVRSEVLFWIESWS